MMKIRERIEKYGVDTIITEEGLSVLLGIPAQKLNGVNVKYLLENYRNKERFILTDLQRTKIQVLEKIIIDFSKENNSGEKITSANHVAKIMMPKIGINKKEHFYSIMLDTKNKIIEMDEISKGSLTATVVHPREVFKEAILASANSIILCHNHPSGDPSPSIEDMHMTQRLKKAGELIGITVLDHIIVGSTKYFSFKEDKQL